MGQHACVCGQGDEPAAGAVAEGRSGGLVPACGAKVTGAAGCLKYTWEPCTFWLIPTVCFAIGVRFIVF